MDIQPMVAGAPVVRMTTQKISECLKILEKISRIYGFEGEFDNKRTVDHWMVIMKEIGMAKGQHSWQKLVKYKLNAFFAFHTRQAVPAKPFTSDDNPAILFHGRLGRFMTLLLKRATRMEKYSFLTSIKQSKKGMPRALGVTFLKEKENEVVKKLTQKPGLGSKVRSLIDWSKLSSQLFQEEFPEQINITLSDITIKTELRRTVKEIFGGEEYTARNRVQAFFPSTSANYINNRDNAGAVGSILQHSSLLKGLRVPGGYLRFEDIKERGKEGEEKMESEDEIVWKSQDGRFQSAFTTLWLRVLSEAAQEIPNAEPVALPEPLKTRVITKGPPFIQTVMRALWKKMHSILRVHPAFRLIGEPISEAYISQRLGRCKKDEYYLSGDYEGATDNLKSWVSEEIADAISDELKLYPVERRIFKTSLIKHILRGQPQTAGQLMGSITSFPVLCLANAALSRWAMELGLKKRLSLAEAPIAINGDDIACRTTREGYEFWRTITQSAGLIESIGKTYLSKDFVEMNSAEYLPREEEPKGGYMLNPQPLLKRVPFVNMGLLTGLKRSGQTSIGLNDQFSGLSNIGARYRKLIDESPLQMRENVHYLFVEEHKELLEKMKPIPWHIPEWLGGLGMLGVKEPSELDLRIAHMILTNWKTIRPTAPQTSEATWQTWKLAESKVPQPFYVNDKENPGVKEYERTVADKCIDLLFDSNITLDDLKTTVEFSDTRARKELSKNQKLWTPSRYPHLREPLSFNQLKFRPLYSSYRNESHSLLPSQYINQIINDLS